MAEFDIDEVLSLIGFGRIHILILLVSGLMLLLVVNELMGMTVLIVVAKKDLEMRNEQCAILSSAAYLGMIISSHFMGFKTDQVGRRCMLLYSTVASCACSVISAFMPSFWYFVFWRFMMGIFLITPSTTNFTYIAEFCKSTLRPKIMNGLSFFAGLSMLYIACVAYFVGPLSFRLHITSNYVFNSWRLIVLCYTLPPSVVIVIIMGFLPETPKFLLSQGKNDEAYEVLNWLCLKNRGKSLDSFDIKRDSVVEAQSTYVNEDQDSFFKQIWYDSLPLFRPPYVWPLALATLIMFGLFFVGNGFAVWFLVLTNKKGSQLATLCDLIETTDLHNNTDDNIVSQEPKDDIKKSTGLFYYGLLSIAGCLVLTLLVWRLQRNRVLFIYMFISSVSGFSLNFYHYQPFILLSFIMFVMMPANLISLMVSVIVDIVPTALRGKAVNVSCMFGRLGVIVASFIVGVFMHDNCLITLNIFVAYMTLCSLLSCLLP